VTSPVSSGVVRAGSVPLVQGVRRSTGEALGRVASLSEAAGLRVLGVAIEELAPGRRSSPAHAHSEVEEAVFVLNGTVTVHLGERMIEAGPGDLVAFPAGGPLHSVENRGPEPAKLLVLRVGAVGDRVRYGAEGGADGSTGGGPR